MEYVGFFGCIAALGFICWCLFGVLFASGRRKRRLKMAGLGLVALMISSVVLVNGANNEAREEGFEDISDQAAAKKAGVSDPLAWKARKQEAKLLAEAETVKRHEEKTALQRAETAKKMEDQAKLDAEAAKREQEYAALQQAQAVKEKEEEEKAAAQKLLAERARQEDCRKDLKCWAENTSIDASVDCMIAVQALAKWDYQWTDGWMTESKFSRYRWKDQSKGIVTYLGDKLKMQNGFGAWKHVTYTCDYDPIAKKVINASAF